MLKTIACLLITVSLIFPAQAALLSKDNVQIIVAGQGIVKAPSDVSYVMIGVERTEATATQAQNIAAQKMNNVLGSLKKLGIPKDKIQTSSFRLYPKNKYEQGERILVGYTASNQIKVTLDDLSKIGKIIDTTIAAGANDVSNITFTVKDPAPFKKTALQKAFQDAKAKAEVIAAASGLVIKKIKSIQEAGAVVAPPGGIRAFKSEALEAETPIVPGKVEVRGSLTVVYECSAK